MDASSIPTDGATAVSADPNFMDTVTQIADLIGKLSISLAQTSGDVADTSEQINGEAVVLKSVAAQTGAMASQAQTVKTSASIAVEISDSAEASMTETSAKLGSMVSEVTGLIDAVTRISDQLSSLDNTLTRVATVSSEVDNISRKTNLLSLNASIEAARAGRHGRGFMVVAQEVKDLSNLTSEATGEIQETVGALSTELRGLMRLAKGAVDSAATIQETTDGIGTQIEEIPATLSKVSSSQREILAATSDISSASTDVGEAISSLSKNVNVSSGNLKTAQKTLGDLTQNSEQITGMLSQLGVETVDTPYIRAVQEVAAQVSQVFSDAVRNGTIAAVDLMDRNYVEIPGSNPQQVVTRFTGFTDAVLPSLQEKMLEFASNVVFCAAVNKDGYLPTHNVKFSQPQNPDDPVFNAANSRNRRIFDDRVGLAAGNNTEPFLLQAYRRDMGNGEFVMMKDLSAPIYVNGTHWGGLRLAYKV